MTTTLVPSAEQVQEHLAHAWGMTNVYGVTQLPPSPGSVVLYRIDSVPRQFLYIVGRAWGEDYWERAAVTAAHLTKQNFPTPRFILTIMKRIIARAEGGDCILRDWLKGDSIPRQELTPDDRVALGQTLGRCHRLLMSLPASLTSDWSDAKRCELIGGLQASFQQLDRTEKTPNDVIVLEAITRKVSLLEELTIPYDQLRICPHQVVHGDFHPLNVLFNEQRRVAGVIDFSGWSNLRILDVLHAAIHCQSADELVPLDLSEIGAFMSGYLLENSLSMPEIRAGINLYWRDLLWRYGGVAAYIREPSDAYARQVTGQVELAEWLRHEGSHLKQALQTLVEP